MGDRTLDYIALCVLIFVVLTLVYGIIYIHDIPYEIAKKRKHPHRDAIHTAGWVSLFLMHTIWPFLWIWATLYKPDDGWGIASSSNGGDSIEGSQEELFNSLKAKVVELEERKDLMQEEFTAKLDQLHSRIAELEQQLQKGGEVS